LYNGNIPDNIQVGIDAMKKFNPELRLRAKMLQHYIFDELNYIIGMKTRQQVLMMDNDELQKYSNLLKNIEKDIPNMLKRIEDGNGIKTVERGTKKTCPSKHKRWDNIILIICLIQIQHVQTE